MKYNQEDFKQLRHVGALTFECLMFLGDQLKAGITTEDIDDLVKRYAEKHNLKCATNGYRGFPANCCTSVNHVACHGIPSRNKKLKDGDIISIDVTFINSNGYYGDSCYTYEVGEVSRKAELVKSAARGALWKGIEEIVPGNHIGHIGNAIQKYIEQETTCSVVKELVGHGIGKKFHESPDIPHTCREFNISKTPILEPGMVFTVEPIINAGGPSVKVLNDGWTTVTSDKNLSAQYEHTIGVTEKGCEIFTI